MAASRVFSLNVVFRRGFHFTTWGCTSTQLPIPVRPASLFDGPEVSLDPQVHDLTPRLVQSVSNARQEKTLSGDGGSLPRGRAPLSVGRRLEPTLLRDDHRRSQIEPLMGRHHLRTVSLYVS